MVRRGYPVPLLFITNSDTNLDLDYGALTLVFPSLWSLHVLLVIFSFIVTLQSEFSVTQLPGELSLTCENLTLPHHHAPLDFLFHSSQFQPDDASANSVLQYAVENLGVEHGMLPCRNFSA